MQKLPYEFEVEVLELDINSLGVDPVSHSLFLFDRGCRSAFSKIMAFFATLGAPLVVGSHDHFSDDKETGFVSSQSQHNQVGIGSVNAVNLVGVIGLRSSLLANKLHNFVLAFSRTAGVGKDHRQVFPESVIGHFIFDVLADSQGHVREESGAWGDQVRVKALLVDVLLDIADISVLLAVLFQQLQFFLFVLGSLHGCSEPSGTLLVHFGPGSHSVNGQVEEFAGTNDVHDLIDVDEDVLALLVEVLRNSDIFVFGVDAGMDQPVHVDVEIVDFGVGGHRRVRIGLRGVFEHFGVAHAHPFEEDRNAHISPLLPKINEIL